MIAAQTELGPDHPETAIILERLAKIELQENQWDRADPLLRQAHAARQRGGLYSFDEFLHDVAVEFESEQDWPAARLLRTKLVEVCGQSYGEDHWKRQEAHHRLESTERLAQLTEDARQELQQAKRLLDAASRNMDQGKFPSALRDALAAMEIRKRLLGLEQRDTATAITYVSLIHKYLGRYEECLEFALLDKRITEKIQGPTRREPAVELSRLRQSTTTTAH